jgi:hypothetical protein
VGGPARAVEWQAMCEVWKWIIIGTAIPLVGLSFWTFPLWGWYTQRQMNRGLERTARLLAYQRFIWLGMLIVTFATVVYLIHCTD